MSRATYTNVTTFHWAVAQLTLGSIEIVCANSIERIYNVFCMLIGLLFGSALISSLSATMVEIQTARKDQTQKLRVLRHYYMRENPIKAKLSNFVMAFQLLSQSLRTDLRFAVFKPYILRHPLFLLWYRVDPSVLSHMCQEHVDMMHLSPQDDLFLPGAKCDKAYYVVEGDVDYIQEPSTSAVTGRTVQKVPKGAWISAAALWCQWIHVGQAVAHTTTELMWVNAEGVFNTMTRHSLVHDISLRYARSFQQRLFAAEPPHANYPSDIDVPFTKWATS
jgi:hypothetical protein